MSIPKLLIDKFAKIINSGKEPEKEVYFYGEVKMDGDVKCVQLDGSNTLTPCEETADSQPGTGDDPGDRVLVLIKNHTATIIGNATYPSLARILANGAQNTADGAASAAAAAQTAADNAAKTATDYITQNQNGSLEIGNSGSGSKNVLSSDGQRIYRKNGNSDQLLAEFLASKITLNDAEISKNQNESTLWIKNTAGPIGITNGASGVSSYVNVLNNSVVIQNGGSGYSGWFEVFKNKIVLKISTILSMFITKEMSLEMSNNDILVKERETIIDEDTLESTITETSAKIITENSKIFTMGKSIVTVNNGTVSGTNLKSGTNVSYTTRTNVSNGTIPANGNMRFSFKPNVPTGYTLVGISAIDTNHANVIQITGFGVKGTLNNESSGWPETDNVVTVVLHNSHTSALTNTEVYIYWFAVKSSNLN